MRLTVPPFAPLNAPSRLDALPRSQRPSALAPETGHYSVAPQGNQVNGTGHPGLEAHRSACRHREPQPPGKRTVEGQAGVRFGEVVVRTDLYRPVGRVGDGQGGHRTAGVELEIAGPHGDLPGE